MDGPLEQFYSPKLWIHFPRVIFGELVVVKYHLYVRFAHIRMFRHFFHTAQAFPHEVDSHMVAPATESALWYWSFGVMCSIPQFDGFIVLVVFLIDINELEESSDEEDGM